MKCALCRYGPATESSDALFIIDGHGVCEEHVDEIISSSFREMLDNLWREHREENKR